MKQFLPSVSPLVSSLRSLAVLLVILALVLALVVQQRRVAVRLRTLQAALANAEAIRAAEERIRDLFGDRGLSILKTATRVETLRVGRGAGFPRTPTGVELDEATATQLRLALLDPHNYVYLDADDMPEPQAGFRFRDGCASLDILVSLEGSSLNSPHEDIFVFINSECGTNFYKGYFCMYSASLHDLLVFAMRPNGNR